jgi:hypothetical protein
MDDSTCSTTSITSSSSRGSKSKKVRFRVSQFTYFEPPPATLPPINTSELFYTKEELAEICSENRAILRCIQLGDAYCRFCDDVNSPTRGLEDRSWEGARRRFWNQRNACRAVLQEQERQQKEDIYEPEALADIYSLFSKC